VKFGVFAHNLFWLVVAEKFKTYRRKNEAKREAPEPWRTKEIKISDRNGIWTQCDMNSLSFSGNPPVDR
jgi:hypothetical protein